MWKINLNTSACFWKLLSLINTLPQCEMQKLRSVAEKILVCTHAMISLPVVVSKHLFILNNLNCNRDCLNENYTEVGRSNIIATFSTFLPLSFLLQPLLTVPYVLLSHLSNESGTGLSSSCHLEGFEPKMPSKRPTVDECQCMHKFCRGHSLIFWRAAAGGGDRQY